MLSLNPNARSNDGSHIYIYVQQPTKPALNKLIGRAEFTKTKAAPSKSING